MEFRSFEQSRIANQDDSLNKKKKQPKSTMLKKQEFSEHEQREIRHPIIQEAIKKRNELLETRGLLQMSKVDFDTYFASSKFDIRTDLKQGNTGDCYAVAAIHAMSRSPHFEMICRSSMKKRLDGVWEIKIPLLSKNWRMITISPEELLTQENKQFLKRNKRGGNNTRFKNRAIANAGRRGIASFGSSFYKTKIW